MWTTVGDRTFCSRHNSSTERGIPCAACTADPGTPISDRDAVHLSVPRSSTAFYEERLVSIADRCEVIADELCSGKRSTESERTEPAALAAKFYEVAARCFGRAIDVAAKREAREELDELKRTIREMRGAH